MSLPTHLRMALVITSGAAFFVLFLVTRLVGALMGDPNFGRGDNPFELVSLIGCVLGALLALLSASALAFQRSWAGKVGRAAAIVLLLASVAIVASMAIAGAEETRPSAELTSAQTAAGLASFTGAIGLFFAMRRFK